MYPFLGERASAGRSMTRPRQSTAPHQLGNGTGLQDAAHFFALISVSGSELEVPSCPRGPLALQRPDMGELPLVFDAHNVKAQGLQPLGKLLAA
jgi:hypothetical protein